MNKKLNKQKTKTKVHSNKSQKETKLDRLAQQRKRKWGKQNNIKNIYLQIIQVFLSSNKSFQLCGSFFFTSPLCDHHVTENRSRHVTYCLLLQRLVGGRNTVKVVSVSVHDIYSSVFPSMFFASSSSIRCPLQHLNTILAGRKSHSAYKQEVWGKTSPAGNRCLTRTLKRNQQDEQGRIANQA